MASSRATESVGSDGGRRQVQLGADAGGSAGKPRGRRSTALGARRRPGAGSLRERGAARGQRRAVLLQVRVLGGQELLGDRHGLFELGEGRGGLLVGEAGLGGLPQDAGELGRTLRREATERGERLVEALPGLV